MPRDDMIGLRLINIVNWLIEPRLSDKLMSSLIELASNRKHTVENILMENTCSASNRQILFAATLALFSDRRSLI